MEQLLNDLCDSIDRQLTLYRNLLDLFQDERKAILGSDLEALNRIVFDKERLLQDVRRAEVQRRKIADTLAPRLGIEGEALTITRMSAELAGVAGTAAIKRKGAQLKALIDEIQIESERNRSLCLHALQFVSNSIKMLASLTRPNQVYRATGRVQNGAQIGRMLSGAV